jgi:hypothetical protein
MRTRRCSTSRHTDWPTVSPNVTLKKWWSTQCLGHPLTGGYKCGSLALHVGGFSDETVIYGYGSCATLTNEWLHCKLQTRPHPSRQRGCPTWRRKEVIVTQRKLKCGHGPQRDPDTKTNCPTDRRSQYNLNLVPMRWLSLLLECGNLSSVRRP